MKAPVKDLIWNGLVCLAIVLVASAIVLRIVHNSRELLSWHDKEAQIVKHQDKLYKLVEVKTEYKEQQK